MIARFEDYGAFYTLDAGNSWQAMQSGLPANAIYSASVTFGQVGSYVFLSLLDDTGRSPLFRSDISSLIPAIR